MIVTEHKVCPFCGGKPVRSPATETNGVELVYCGTQNCGIVGIGMLPHEWERRVPQSKEVG